MATLSSPRETAALLIAVALFAQINVHASLGSASGPGRQLVQQHHAEVPVPFAYCKPYLERLSQQDQHQLRESYQEYHAAFARYQRAARNLEAFNKGPAVWMTKPEEAWLRQGWNMTYLFGQNNVTLAEVLRDATTVKDNMENRIKAQLQQLEGQGNLPRSTALDALSPCIMRKIYPSRFPDQPELSLLLRLRGDSPLADWPAVEHNTTAPPSGRGPDAVAAFLKRAMACRTVAPLELIVMLSGSQALVQATTWAWQSWQTDGFVVPLLDSEDREAHALNRLASVARGSVLVALRADRASVDDLLPGAECAWLQRLATLYHRIPQLGAMAHGRYSFSHPPAEAALRLLGAPGSSGPQSDNQFFKEGVTNIPFQYVLYGDLMPMSFRRSALEEVGGFDEDLPQGDEPCSSYIRRDLTARLWKSGWRVGAHDVGMLQRPLEDTTLAQSNNPMRCNPEVAALSLHLLEARHGPLPPAAGSPAPLELLMARVRELNMRKLAPMAPDALASCPMQQGCSA